VQKSVKEELQNKAAGWWESSLDFYFRCDIISIYRRIGYDGRRSGYYLKKTQNHFIRLLILNAFPSTCLK
jgi:hypothetical protein